MKKNAIFIFLLLASLPGISKIDDNLTAGGFYTGHFGVAWTGNGYNQMNINVLSAKIGGVDLAAGDEIAAFDGSVCVGLIAAPFGSPTIIASQANGDMPGFTAGHSIVFKFWDASKSLETSSITVTNNARQPYSPVFEVLGSAMVRLSATTELTVQIGADNKVYDGNTDANVPVGSVVKTGLGSGHIVDVTISNAKFSNKNVGNGKTVTADVSISGTDAAYYTLSPTVTTTANITSRAITLTADAKTKSYGNADPAFTYTVSPAMIGSDGFTGSLSRDPGESLGTYRINQGTLSAGSNYTITYASAYLTIITNVTTINVTATARAKTYGAADPVLTYTFTPALSGADAFTGSLSRDPGETVGSYRINQGTLSAGSNYTINYTSANLDIGQTNLIISAKNRSKCIGATISFDTDDITANGLVFNDIVSNIVMSSSGTSINAATGNYEISISGATGTGLSNYTISYVKGTLKVNPLPTATISGSGIICAGQSATLSIAFTGTAPWSITFTDGTTSGTLTNIVANPFTFSVTPVGTQVKTYTISSVSDFNGCSNSGLSGAVITIRPTMTASTAGQSQTVCWGTGAATLTATPATGAGNAFTYQWQQSIDSDDWTDTTAIWTNIAGASKLDFTPGVISASTYYRIIANDPICGGIGSNYVKVDVMRATLPGTLSGDQIIQPGTAPAPIISLAPGSGSGMIGYSWGTSIDEGITWSTIAGETGPGCAPGILNQSTWYQRVTLATENSTVCSSASDAVKIKVQSSGTDLQGQLPDPITAFANGNVEIIVKGEILQPSAATLYDIQGRAILSQNLAESSINRIKTPYLKTGIYILFISTNEKSYRIKLPVRE